LNQNIIEDIWSTVTYVLRSPFYEWLLRENYVNLTAQTTLNVSMHEISVLSRIFH